MAAPQPGAGTAMSLASHESLRSAQAARSGHGVNLATPGTFSQKMNARRGGLVEEAWQDLVSGRRRLGPMAHNAFCKMKKQVPFFGVWRIGTGMQMLVDIRNVAR
ncbi:hypothetical protein V502_06849 [Pseudogymnoascus sp. VKM F-4520 (FW-2644)]|nr:hypothetical protein V502_06849 [Pseudogymnoascus sp. VKM F-4520 (FW-2644)]